MRPEQRLGTQFDYHPSRNLAFGLHMDLFAIENAKSPFNEGSSTCHRFRFGRIRYI